MFFLDSKCKLQRLGEGQNTKFQTLQLSRLQEGLGFEAADNEIMVTVELRKLGNPGLPHSKQQPTWG